MLATSLITITHYSVESLLQTGEIAKISKPSGMKLELFTFYVFPPVKNFVILELLRGRHSVS